MVPDLSILANTDSHWCWCHVTPSRVTIRPTTDDRWNMLTTTWRLSTDCGSLARSGNENGIAESSFTKRQVSKCIRRRKKHDVFDNFGCEHSITCGDDTRISGAGAAHDALPCAYTSERRTEVIRPRSLQRSGELVQMSMVTPMVV